MNKKSRWLTLLPAWCLALGLALGAAHLLGCTPQNGGSSGGSTKEAGVWVMTKDTQTYTVGEDSSTVVTEYSLDEHGNITTAVMGDAYSETHEFDDDGAVTAVSVTYANGDKEEIAYTTEKDTAGRAVRIEGTDGSVEERSYDDEGNLVRRTMTAPYQDEDPDGNPVSSTYQVEVTYDADGFVLQRKSLHGSEAHESTNTLERDSEGRVTATVRKAWTNDDEGNPIEESVSEVRTTIEYDDNGNIVRAYTQGEGYTLEDVYEYAYIEDPSAEARVTANMVKHDL